MSLSYSQRATTEELVSGCSVGSGAPAEERQSCESRRSLWSALNSLLADLVPQRFRGGPDPLARFGVQSI